jgi:GMP synthase-like glutamine amidotransferase
MRIHYFQHVEFETLGGIADWIKLRGHSLTGTRFYCGEIPPAPDELDWLIIMGGPMGVHDTHQYAWLTAEKHFIDQAIDRNCRVLGVCLGAQLVADVLGAKVFPNPHKEIGWYPVNRTPEGRRAIVFRDLLSPFTAFHWHGDTFELAPGALRLAESAGCKQQAFVFPFKIN